MTQEISITQPGTFKLGVDDPILLDGKSTTGRRLTYEMLTPDTADLDGIVVTPKAIGEIQIRAIAPADQGYEESETTISFDVVDGDFFERAAAINRIKGKLDSDVVVLNEVAKVSISEVKELTFIVNQSSGAKIKINNQTYGIAHERFLREWINGSIAFWESKMTSENVRLQDLINQLKAL